MSNSTATLIPTTSFGTAGGNYDGNINSFDSNAAIGDGYYGGEGLHSASYTFTNFLGNIQLQGTLAKTPTASDWFAIGETIYSGNLANISNVATVSTTSFNFTGNFVWVRANVTAFSQGTINKVLFNRG